jgi:hypothetical protein
MISAEFSDIPPFAAVELADRLSALMCKKPPADPGRESVSAEYFKAEMS